MGNCCIEVNEAMIFIETEAECLVRLGRNGEALAAVSTMRESRCPEKLLWLSILKLCIKERRRELPGKALRGRVGSDLVNTSVPGFIIPMVTG
jgi:hypothetical protein